MMKLDLESFLWCLLYTTRSTWSYNTIGSNEFWKNQVHKNCLTTIKLHRTWIRNLKDIHSCGQMTPLIHQTIIKHQRKKRHFTKVQIFRNRCYRKSTVAYSRIIVAISKKRLSISTFEALSNGAKMKFKAPLRKAMNGKTCKYRFSTKFSGFWNR